MVDTRSMKAKLKDAKELVAKGTAATATAAVATAAVATAAATATATATASANVKKGKKAKGASAGTSGGSVKKDGSGVKGGSVKKDALIAVPSGGLIPAMLHHTVESNVQSIGNMMVITNALLQLAGRQETRIGTLEAKQKADVASLHGTIHGIEEKIDAIERKIAN